MNAKGILLHRISPSKALCIKTPYNKCACYCVSQRDIIFMKFHPFLFNLLCFLLSFSFSPFSSLPPSLHSSLPPSLHSSLPPSLPPFLSSSLPSFLPPISFPSLLPSFFFLSHHISTFLIYPPSTIR